MPSLRLRAVVDGQPDHERAFVLYWMTAHRRHDFNYGLQRAVEWAKELGKPLVVLEALRCDYRWASDRIHRFVIRGMVDNAKRFETRGVTYLAYVEPKAGDAKGLLARLAKHAALVVTDDFPCFFLPRMLEAAARCVDTRLEAVDGNGLLPIRAADKDFGRAYDFRRFLQRTLVEHIFDFPKPDPLRAAGLPTLEALPKSVARWHFSSADELSTIDLAKLPIDHSVGLVELRGGSRAAGVCVRRFLSDRLDRYADERNAVDEPAASGLSPYLHFGHVSAHRIFRDLAHAEDWDPGTLVPTSAGKREGWWGMSRGAESFLDELITWRELGYNKCVFDPRYREFESLPAWVRKNFAETASDPREHVYSLEQFETAQTHDEIWNAAQRELVETGSMHNYLRMLWGKKILEWTPSPKVALEVMIELNNKYALDGRNPNSYSGIFWVLGRYDRPWAPRRPIFGTVRFMSSASTKKKLKLKRYLSRFGG